MSPYTPTIFYFYNILSSPFLASLSQTEKFNALKGNPD